MSTQYTYTKEAVPQRLGNEIAASPIVTAVDYITTFGTGPSMTIDIYFKAELSDDDKVILDTIVLNHIPTPLPEDVTKIKLDSVDIGTTERAIKVTPTKLEGSSTTMISHNFCDPTTWYTESVKVTGETLQVSDLDNKVFVSGNNNWIDLTHGKVPYEHRLVSNYPVKIYVDDILVTNGFTIDYSTGVVTFTEPQTGVVKATYNKSSGSGWYIKPDAGKILKIIGTDVKVTEDVMLDPHHAIVFQLCVMNGAVPYGSPTIYNNMEDIIKCSAGVAFNIPAFSIFNKSVMVLPFDYTTSKDLSSSSGAVIKIKLSNNIAIPGTFGVVVAHCISIAE